ncbi:carbohydrate porin [Vibrio sp. SM6]|uniref:Carbohydrate porin n=1 Tax=Vibrio agarilyticus TaxID=2726741 RepID=A0A7X8TP99_9VIBR|nr:carbohydrate porin [Vibrio agarilyticus]NLS11683.1 carbohydrate porin [Vibrio agarilyticus]
MRNKILTKSVLAVGISTILAAPALAENKATSDFEFHGYFRAGALSSAKNDLKQHDWGGQKETLGRLGLEADDFYELAFVQRWDWKDGDSVRINARLGQDNPNGNGSNAFANIDGKATGLIEAFVELDGVTETGVLWAGQRYYGRDNYIFMTDFFYTDYSGTGMGVQDAVVGDGYWDFAYIASNNSVGTNEMLHALHVRADYGKWRVDTMFKHLGENVNDTATQKYAKNGVEALIQYSPENFFGFGNGFSKVAVQAGKGLGSGTMLGRTFTNYNAYSPGGVGFIDGRTEQTRMSAVDDSDVTVRAQMYGGYFGENWMFFPAVGYEHTKYDDSTKDDNSWWYAMVRPIYTMPQYDNFFIASEFGYTDNSVNRDNGGDPTFKATIAPTWSISTGFGPAPELRLLATYLKGNPGVSSNAGTDDYDIIVGAQVDVWW